MGQPTRLDSPTKMCTDSGCARPLRARGLCASHYNRRYHPTPVRNVECEHCGRAYQTSRWNGRFCSTACHGRFKILQRQSNRCELPADHPVRLLIQQDEARALAARRWPQSRVRFTECATCGSLFVTKYTDSTCSMRCTAIKLADAKRETKHRRRAPASVMPWCSQWSGHRSTNVIAGSVSCAARRSTAQRSCLIR